ncbi:MAG: hypothetical protein ACRDOL_41505 [Streptosporangiaceae bacterium]
MPDGDGTLVSALSELAALATERDREHKKHPLAALPDLVTERGKRHWPNGKVRYGTRAACWTRPRRRARS